MPMEIGQSWNILTRENSTLVPNGVQEIELPNIVGIYFIEISNDDKVYSYKLIKQ